MDPLGLSLVLLRWFARVVCTPKAKLAGNGPGLLDHRDRFF